MRTLLLASVLLASTLSATAQVASGNKFANGTLNFSLINVGESTQSAFSFTPSLGYLISDRTALGGSLGILVRPDGEDSDLTISLSPFVRRFFPIVDDQFYFFVDGMLSLSYGNSAATSRGEFSSSEDAFSVGLSASPGFIYFPAERWSLDFALTGFELSFFGIGENTATLFNLGVTTFSPSLGFSYFF